MRCSAAAVVLLALVGAAPASSAELKPPTVAAFNRYVQATEQRMKDDPQFLWVDGLPASQQRAVLEALRRGELVIDRLTTRQNGKEIDIPNNGDLFNNYSNFTSATANGPGVSAPANANASSSASQSTSTASAPATVTGSQTLTQQNASAPAAPFSPGGAFDTSGTTSGAGTGSTSGAGTTGSTTIQNADGSTTTTTTTESSTVLPGATGAVVLPEAQAGMGSQTNVLVQQAPAPAAAPNTPLLNQAVRDVRARDAAKRANGTESRVVGIAPRTDRDLSRQMPDDPIIRY